MCAVLVVGAGPAGLTTASELAKAGWDVTLIEAQPRIGIKEKCAGLISLSGIEELGLDVSRCTHNEIYGADIFSPSGHKLTIEKDEPVAVVVSRRAFDEMLLKECTKSGVRLEFCSKLIDVRKENVFVQSKNRGELRKTKIVVGADGANSKSREIAGIKVDESFFVSSYQVRAKGSFERNKVKLYIGSFAKGLFAWVIPESDSVARIGIATSVKINPKEAFDDFIRKNMLEFEKIEDCSALIPCGPPIAEPVKQNIMLVGDAAFHTKASTGGGIIMGINAAKKCAQAINKHFREGAELKEYSKLLAPITKELKIHWKIRKYLNGLSDAAIDKLFVKAKNVGLEEFLSEHGDMDWPSRFLPKIISKPRFWRFLPLLLKFR